MSSTPIGDAPASRQEWLAREYPRDGDHLADSAAEYERREGRSPETLPARKDREKICRLCGARVTKSPSDDAEYGHLRRPITVADGRFVFPKCPHAVKRGDER